MSCDAKRLLLSDTNVIHRAWILPSLDIMCMCSAFASLSEGRIHKLKEISPSDKGKRMRSPQAAARPAVVLIGEMSLER